tara:strand:+ start:413 stop:994 length:582 start_codon:yes stop_codon:yes gene_type:complete
MKNNYRILKNTLLHDGFFKLKELTLKYKKHNGDWSQKINREIFVGASVAAVLPYDHVKKKIILNTQFRAGVLQKKINPKLTEIVAGIIDKNETPRDAAIRECKEETGCKIKKIRKIFSYFPMPASCETYYHVFLGEVDSFRGTRITGKNEEDEDILVKCFNISEVEKLVKENKIMHGLTLTALQWFFLKYYTN